MSQGDSMGESHSIGERDEASLSGEPSLEDDSICKWDGTTAREEGGVGRVASASHIVSPFSSFMANVRLSEVKFHRASSLWS